MDAARAAAPDRVFIDVDYRVFVADPIGTVREIYGVLARELTSDAEAAMARWVVDRPKDKHGVHRYAAADFGLTENRIRARIDPSTDRAGRD